VSPARNSSFGNRQILLLLRHTAEKTGRRRGLANLYEAPAGFLGNDFPPVFATANIEATNKDVLVLWEGIPMQNSLWKLVTAAGIIGIGTLVVLEVQHRLPGNEDVAATEQTAAAEQTPLVGENSMIPDPTTEFDLLFQDMGEPTLPATAVAMNTSGGDSDGAISTRVSRANLQDSENPFAAFPGGESSAVPANTPDRQPITQVSHSPGNQDAPFTADDAPETTDDVPVFSLSDAADTTASTEAAAPVEWELGSSVPVRTAAAAPADETQQRSEPPAGDFDPNGFFAEDMAADTAPATGNDSDSTSRAIYADEESGETFTPFALDPVTPTDNATGADNPNATIAWPALADETTSPPAAVQDDAGSRTEALPQVGNLEPFPETDGPEFGITDTGQTGGGSAQFFEDDLPSEPPPQMEIGRNQPIEQDSNGNEFPPFELDPTGRATLNSDEELANTGRVPAGNSPDRMRINDTNPTPEPLLPVIEPALSDRDVPPLNLTPDWPSNGLVPTPRLPGSDLSWPNEQDSTSSTGEVIQTSATMTSVMRPHLTVQKNAPGTATVGVPLEYTITVSNDGQTAATDVIVEDILPAAADLETAQPIPDYDREARRLSWQVKQLPAGESRTILVRIVPNGEGTLDGVATVKFKAAVRSTTLITAPDLKLTMTGPSEVRLGETVSFTFKISNEGSGTANQVILRNVLPAGLQHPEGNDLEYEISSLASGEQHEVTLEVMAAEPGEFKNAAEVTSAGVATDSTSVPISVVGSQLTIERLGPQRRYVGRTAQFQNIITNDTVFDAANAVVIERIPEGFQFVAAGNGGEYNPAERLITWRLASIPAGKQALLDVELKADRPGKLDSVVEVIEDAGFRSRATRTVAIEDIHNISADISRLAGPVAVGEKFGFSIVVDNRGTAVAQNVQLHVEVPRQIKVLAAGSNEMSASKTPDNVVRYATVLEIGPNQKKVFQLSLQGDLPVQNALVQAHLKYEGMQQPLVVSESVTVYSDSL
jgi:uncharacterized repeat protein (TIGR01451 family)